ncbi:MAG: PAS domain-containing protein, partial [Gemmataceae bacterium]|nr:PAS domain-containing protein [Gemmataceae bacterium]
MTQPAEPPGSPDARLLGLVAARTHSAVVITNARGEIEWVNAGFTRVSGYSLAEARGRRPGDLLQGPDTDPGTVAHMRARMRAGLGFRAEVLNYHKSGARYWLDIDVQPVTDGAGAVTHFIAVEQDITARKVGEERLARLVAVQEAILGGVTACVVSTDTAGTVATFNPAAELELGYSAGVGVGRETPV